MKSKPISPDFRAILKTAGPEADILIIIYHPQSMEFLMTITSSSLNNHLLSLTEKQIPIKIVNGIAAGNMQFRPGLREAMASLED